MLVLYIIFSRKCTRVILIMLQIKKTVSLGRLWFRRYLWPVGLFTPWLYTGRLKYREAFFRVAFVGWPISGRFFVWEAYFGVFFLRLTLCLDGIFPSDFFFLGDFCLRRRRPLAVRFRVFFLSFAGQMLLSEGHLVRVKNIYPA